MGIDMKDNDLAFRANVVTLSDEPRLEDCVMLDYSSGEITSEESAQLVATLKNSWTTVSINCSPAKLPPFANLARRSARQRPDPASRHHQPPGA